MIFALLDECDEINTRHLLAAREVWRYCEESARYTFGEALQNSAANEILAELRARPNGMTRTEISRDLYRANKLSTDIEAALRELQRLDLATYKDVPNASGGKPTQRWFPGPK